MATKSLDERLNELYDKRDNVGQQFNSSDIKTIVEGIRDAREKGGTPIKGATATELQPDETPTAEMTSDGTLVLGIPKGQKGDDGKQGDPGEQGKSAYQVWLEEGNEGTEADFLNSLKAHVSAFVPVTYNETAAGKSVGQTYDFALQNPIDGSMVIMPNAGSAATGSIMFSVSVQDGVATYTRVGDVAIDTSDFLSSSAVDGTELKNPTTTQVAKATDVMSLNAKLEGVTLSESKVSLTENSNYFDGRYVKSDGTIREGSTPSQGAANGILIVNVSNVKRVRFLGAELDSSTTAGYGFSSKDTIDPTITSVQLEYAEAFKGDASARRAIEIIVDVPTNMKWFVCTIHKYRSQSVSAIMTLSDFYCYTMTGASIKDVIKSENRVATYKDVSIDEADYLVTRPSTNGGTESRTGNRIDYIFDLSKHDFRGKTCVARQPLGGGLFIAGYRYITQGQYASTEADIKFIPTYTTDEVQFVFPDKMTCHYLRFTFKKADNSNFTNTERQEYLDAFEFECKGENEAITKGKNYPLPDFVNGYFSVAPSSSTTNGTATKDTSAATAAYRVVTKDYVAVPYDNCKFKVVLPENERLQMAFAYDKSGSWYYVNRVYRFKNGDTFQVPAGYTHFMVAIARYNPDGTTNSNLEMDADKINALVNNGEIALLYNSDTIADRIVAEPYIDAVMDKYNAADKPVPRTAAIFVHTSDVHGDVVRWCNALELAKKFDVDAIINTGDNVAHSVPNGMSYIAKYATKAGVRTLITTGNHDSSDHDNATFEQNLNTSMYNEVIKDLAGVTLNGYVMPSSSDYDDAPTYYYADFEDKHIRFIALNLYEQGRNRTSSDDGVYSAISQKQINWFIATLASTPAGYGVLVGYHRSVAPVAKDDDYSKFWQEGYTPGYPPSGWALQNVDDYPITRIVDAFISRSTLSGSYHQTLLNNVVQEITISADFTNVAEGVEFIAHLFGHHHRDTIGYYKTPQGSDFPVVNKQLCLNVCCTTSKYSNTYTSWANPSDMARGLGDTINQDCFNVYSIDRSAKVVRIARVGSNVSSETLKVRDYMAIPYNGVLE